MASGDHEFKDKVVLAIDDAAMYGRALGFSPLLAHGLLSRLGNGQIDQDRSQRHHLAGQGFVADNLVRFQPLEQGFRHPLAQLYAIATAWASNPANSSASLLSTPGTRRGDA